MNKSVRFLLSIENPSTHYCNIKLNFIHDGGIKKFSIPVWTPGSYLVREFARFISQVKCEGENCVDVQIEKINKNTWEVNTSPGMLSISYKVYCNEMSVRTSVINDQRAFINGSNIFMRVDGFENCKHFVEFDLPNNWKHISTGLYHESGNTYFHNNYDDFIDCPVQTGNQHIKEFDVKGVKHTISINGIGNFDPQRFKSEYKSIVETQTGFFGGIPYDFYVFLISLEESGYGGLEHKNSFAAIYPRWDFNDEKTYMKFLGLISHEFFHLWNVKRIRPVELEKFDYDNENYTISHWITEGWTSFYDNLFLYRAKLVNEVQYLTMVEREVNEVMHYSGRHEMSLTESSFDNWIKFYRRHENTRNEQISYYTKGALVATILNLEIIASTNCKNSLDNVILDLWEDYKSDPSKGYTQQRVKELCEKACGKNLEDFWNNYISGTVELPLEKYFKLAGYELINKNKDKISLDVTLTEDTDYIILNEVHKGGTAYESGLQHNDEIIAIDGMRVNKNNLEKVVSSYKLNEKIEVTVNRNGYLLYEDVTIIPSLPEYEIKLIEKISDRQKKVKMKWLNG